MKKSGNEYFSEKYLEWEFGPPPPLYTYVFDYVSSCLWHFIGIYKQYVFPWIVSNSILAITPFVPKAVRN